jgi:hypothetical protein
MASGACGEDTSDALRVEHGNAGQDASGGRAASVPVYRAKKKAAEAALSCNTRRV